MAPAVILIGCLLATISCSTTAQSTTPPTTDQTNTAAVPTTTTSTSMTFLPSTTPPASTTPTTPPSPTSTLATTPASTTIKTDTTTVPPPSLTSNSSNVTSIPVTTRPGVTNATTTTTTTQTPVYGSCGNPDLCCSGLNSSCHRLNCFCDVACLRLRDCCPDFKPTCLTVDNNTNSTKPNNTLPLTGKCSEPTLCCSGLDYTCFRGCFCDQNCKLLNDCCPDINSTCLFNTTTAAPPFNLTTAPPFTSTTAPPKDVPTVLTILEARVLTRSSSSEEERQAVMRQVGALLENLLGVNNTDIISLKVIKMKPVSPYD